MSTELYTVRYSPTDRFGDLKGRSELLQRLDLPGHISPKGQQENSVAAGLVV